MILTWNVADEDQKLIHSFGCFKCCCAMAKGNAGFSDL